MNEVTQERNLDTVLTSVIAEINKSKDKQREIDDLLATRHDVPHGTIHEILANPIKLNRFTDDAKAAFVLALFEVTQDPEIDPKNYYNTRQLNKAKKYKQEKEAEIKFPYTFDAVVLQSSPEDFITVLSYQEIAKLWNKEMLTYNYQTQRLSKKKMMAKGNIKETADVNLNSVKNIVRLMEEGKYSPSTIIINILVDGSSSIDYSNGELTINEGSTVNIIDGFHRLSAILQVLENDPEFNGYMNVDIKHYTLEKAQRHLAVTNLVNRFDKTLIKNYLAESLGSQIAKDLMNTPELKNRVSIKTTIDKKIGYFTNFSILSEAIESIFEPKNTKDRYDIAETLKKFFGYLINAYEKQLVSERTENAKVSWFTHHNTFVAFVVIAKKLYDKFGKEFPVDEIVRIVDSISFSKEKSELNDILTTQGKVNSNQVKKNIRKFFEEKVDELLQ